MRLLTYSIFFCLLGISYAEIYLAYTNNSGTYTEKRPATPYEEIQVQSVHVSENTENAETEDQNDLQVETVQNKSSVVNVPVSINDNNVNNNFGLRNLHSVQRTGYTYRNNDCVSCKDENRRVNSYPPLEPASDSVEDVDAKTDCCYISKKRHCLENNGVYTCKTQVLQACGERCHNPKNGEEAYFQTDLDNPKPVSKPKKKVTHPYANVPHHEKTYPGKRHPRPSVVPIRPRERPYGRTPGARYPWNNGEDNFDQGVYDTEFDQGTSYHDVHPPRPYHRPGFRHKYPGHRVRYPQPNAYYPNERPVSFYRNPQPNNFYRNPGFSAYYGYYGYGNNYNGFRRNRRRYRTSYAPTFSYQNGGDNYYKK